jgi:hypothetical protein
MENLENSLPEEIPGKVEPAKDHTEDSELLDDILEDEYEINIRMSRDLRNAYLEVDPELLKIFKNYPDAALRIHTNPYIEVMIGIKDFRDKEIPEG